MYSVGGINLFLQITQIDTDSILLIIRLINLCESV